MDTRFAVISWGWSLKSDCLDSAAFASFLRQHYGNGTEQVCGYTTDFSAIGGCNAPLIVIDPDSKNILQGTRHPVKSLWSGLPALIRPDGRKNK